MAAQVIRNNKKYFKIAKAWIPRKCFVCGKKGGWGEKNVDAIWVHGFRIGYFWGHFHQHCLKDAICCPENYKNEVVDKAVCVYKKWDELFSKEKTDILKKKMELKRIQQQICKGD